MTDQDALLAAVLAAPGDDLPRLLYADRLDETGERADADRARFIRTQLRLAELATEVKALAVFGNDSEVSLEFLQTWDGKPIAPEQRARCEEALALMWRERELLKERQSEWLAGTPLAAPEPSGPTYGLAYWLTKFNKTWRRGFLAEIGCDWTACRDHLDALRRVHPIEKVVLTSRPEFHEGQPVYVYGSPRIEVFHIAGVNVDVPGDAAVCGDLLPILAARWPAVPGELGLVVFELPPASPMYLNDEHGDVQVYGDSARDQIEAAVRRQMPAGDRVQWMATPPHDSPRHAIVHDCSHDNAAPFWVGGPPTEEHPTRLLRTVELTLRRFSPRTGNLDFRVYVGRCSQCQMTYLAPAR